MKPVQYKQNPQPGRCSAVNCTNATPHTLCGTCRSRKSRLSDPVRYSFNNLVNHAKARNIICTITLEQFRQWAVKVDYTGMYGRGKNSFDIDRRYNDLGYHIDNIQKIEKVNNIKKYFYYDWREKKVMVERAEQIIPDETII